MFMLWPFSSGWWNFDSRFTSPETCRLKSWKVETKNPEQVLGTVYKTITWFPSEFYLQPVPTTKKGMHWPWPPDWSGPVVGSRFFFEDRVRRFLQEVGGITDNMGMAFEEASSFELRDLKRTWCHWISWKSNSYWNRKCFVAWTMNTSLKGLGDTCVIPKVPQALKAPQCLQKILHLMFQLVMTGSSWGIGAASWTANPSICFRTRFQKKWGRSCRICIEMGGFF